MFPLRDENPVVRPPIATVTLITLNILAWIFVQGWGHPEFLLSSICSYGLIPAELLGHLPVGTIVPLGPDAGCRITDSGVFSLFASMFMHGGWLHIIGNMWFLWVFGDNVEDAMGPWRFLLFYILCGLAAAAAQTITDPASAIPMVGASGAIGGVMGAYALLYPRTHITTFIFLGFYMTTIAVPAWVMLGYWFMLQLLGGLPTLGGSEGGVAFWAHIGGFVAGLLLVLPLHRKDYLAEHLAAAPRRTARHRF